MIVRLDTNRENNLGVGGEEMTSTYGPKSDGVPPGSLGGGGRLMRVGP